MHDYLVSDLEASFADLLSLYKHILDVPYAKLDVTLWPNHPLDRETVCVSTAVEASLLRGGDNVLLSRVASISSHIHKQDNLSISIGAKDISLRPTASVIFHMIAFAWLTPTFIIERGRATPPHYLRGLFRSKLQSHMKCLVRKQKLGAVIVCMIYLPLEVELSEKVGWVDEDSSLRLVRCADRSWAADYMARAEPTTQVGRQIALYLASIM